MCLREDRTVKLDTNVVTWVCRKDVKKYEESIDG